jgi:hypothetical protein
MPFIKNYKAGDRMTAKEVLEGYDIQEIFKHLKKCYTETIKIKITGNKIVLSSWCVSMDVLNAFAKAIKRYDKEGVLEVTTQREAR